MAYLILSTDGLEWDRRELTGPVVLGRSADCEISIHDILLSRRHCRFTPMGGSWLVIDLVSRNGTMVGDRAVEERQLKTGDVIRVGKTKVTFHAEAFVPARQKTVRPAAPPPISRIDDTMVGTIFDLEFEPVSLPMRPPASSLQPTPKPRPKDPASFATDDLYSMLEQIASSSWDSIYAVNAQPLRKNRVIPQPFVIGQNRTRPLQPQVSMTLQAGIAIHDRRPAPARSSRTMGNLSSGYSKQKAAPREHVRPLRRRLARITQWITRVGTLRLF